MLAILGEWKIVEPCFGYFGENVVGIENSGLSNRFEPLSTQIQNVGIGPGKDPDVSVKCSYLPDRVGDIKVETIFLPVEGYQRSRQISLKLSCDSHRSRPGTTAPM